MLDNYGNDKHGRSQVNKVAGKGTWSVGIALLVTGCSNSTGASATACVPFATQACWGPAACQGGQMCQADGSGWSACDCGSTRASEAGSSIDSGLAPMIDAGESPACAQDSTSDSRVCDDGAAIAVPGSRYWINNNVWGRPRNDTASRQCTWLACLTDAGVRWGTSWSWSGGHTVKAFPSVVMGWQWGLRVKGSGLPVQLSENRSIASGWQFSVTPADSGALSLNVTYDLWLHAIPNPDSSGSGPNQPSDEVMIWLYALDTTPAGALVESNISLDDTAWDLWEGPVQTWTTHSFVRRTNTGSSTIDIRDFLNHLTNHRGLASDKYLTSVQAGTEVVYGAGSVDTRLYYCNVQ